MAYLACKKLKKGPFFLFCIVFYRLYHFYHPFRHKTVYLPFFTISKWYINHLFCITLSSIRQMDLLLTERFDKNVCFWLINCPFPMWFNISAGLCITAHFLNIIFGHDRWLQTGNGSDTGLLKIKTHFLSKTIITNIHTPPLPNGWTDLHQNSFLGNCEGIFYHIPESKITKMIIIFKVHQHHCPPPVHHHYGPSFKSPSPPKITPLYWCICKVL